jgi:hypothetical protein
MKPRVGGRVEWRNAAVFHPRPPVGRPVKAGLVCALTTAWATACSRATPAGSPIAAAARPGARTQQVIIVRIWRGVIPIALQTPRSWTRCRARPTAVPTAAPATAGTARAPRRRRSSHRPGARAAPDSPRHGRRRARSAQRRDHAAGRPSQSIGLPNAYTPGTLALVILAGLRSPPSKRSCPPPGRPHPKPPPRYEPNRACPAGEGVRFSRPIPSVLAQS